jgi:regulator of nucleoside diphosphate kinase
MRKERLVITESDLSRLNGLLASKFARVISPVEYLDDLRTELANARVVARQKVPRNVVTMNSTVTLRDLETGERETYTLVYPDRADIAKNRLSVLAPVGTAILGQKVGDELKWRVPAGWRRLKVQRVVYQPEREGALDDEPDTTLPSWIQYASAT